MLGLDLTIADDEAFDLLIVGGGPAGRRGGGLCRGRRAARAGDRGYRDRRPGRHLAAGSRTTWASRPAFRARDLVFRGQVQAMKFGTRFAMPRRVDAADRARRRQFCATLDGGETFCARAVLVATGVQYRRLPIDRLERFEGAGVYYAATEMEARFCRETEAVIIGGGNSAGPGGDVSVAHRAPRPPAGARRQPGRHR